MAADDAADGLMALCPRMLLPPSPFLASFIPPLLSDVRHLFPLALCLWLLLSLPDACTSLPLERTPEGDIRSAQNTRLQQVNLGAIRSAVPL